MSSDRKINLEKDIENTEAGVWIQPEGPGTKPVPLVTGKTIARYKVDYYELVNQIDLTECDFIKVGTIPDSSLSNDLKAIILQQTNYDMNLLSDYKENQFIKKLIVKNLNRDIFVSNAMETALIVDPTHSGLLENKSKQSLHGLKFVPEKESAIVRRLLTLKVPNFRNLSIPQAIELRKDDLWQEFRNNVGRISRIITSDTDVLLDNGNYLDNVTLTNPTKCGINR